MSRLMLFLLLAALWMPVMGIGQTSTQTSENQASATIPPAKIGWIDLQQVIFTCDEGKKEFTEAQRFVEQKNNELEAMRKELQSLRERLEVQGSKLTDEARADLEDQVDSKDIAIQRFQQDTQKEISNRQERITNHIAKRLQPVFEKVSKEKGLNAILVYNPNRDGWVDASLNITEDIIGSYNGMYPVAVAKAPAATPAKKP
jgi:outer membrane protein